MTSRLLLAVPVIALSACGGSAPSAPTAPAPTIQGLRVTGPSRLDERQTAQLSVAAVLTDGTTQPLSAEAVNWQSSNTTVATVSSSGVLFAVRAGVADVRATYQQRTSDALNVAVKAVIPPGPRLNVGDRLEDALTVHGTFKDFVLTASSDGTVTVQLAWDTRQGFLELEVENERRVGFSPLTATLDVVAGGAYHVRIIDGSPWDYDEMNVRFTLGASIK